MNEPKTKLMVGVLGLLAVISFVSAEAITKLSNSVNQNQVAQVSRTSTATSSTIPTITRTSDTVTTTSPTYKRGDSSPIIKEVQQDLADQGIYKGLISGQLGPRTEAAIKEFQTKNGLPATGILDNITIKLFEQKKKLCTPNSTPWIKVVSPNGGEVYQEGQEVEVKWESCNVQNVYLGWVSGGNDLGLLGGESPFPASQGSYLWTVPDVSTWEGTHDNYKIAITIANTSSFDMSDNPFTITEGGDVEWGDNLNGQHIGYIKSISQNNGNYYLVIDYIEWITDCVPDGYNCMNGFEIVNNSSTLNAFTISNNATVIMQTLSHTGDGEYNWNQQISLSELQNVINGSSTPWYSQSIPFWIELQDGVIMKITEQYVP